MSDDSKSQSTRRFLSWGAVSFIEAPSPKVLAISVMTLLSTLAISFVLSFFIEIDVVVKTQGQVDSLNGIKQAVNLVNGQLYYLPVKEGELVKKDQAIGWMRMNGTHEAEVRELIKDLQNRLETVRSGHLQKSDTQISHPAVELVELKEQLIDTSKKLQALYHELYESVPNFKKETGPLKQRITVINSQLRYLENSSVQQYLEMQKQVLVEERGRLYSQISSMENSSQNHLFETQLTTERALELTIALARKVIEDYQVKAPSNGRIARIDSKAGDYLTLGSVVATIIPEDGSLIAEVFVPTKDISKVREEYKVIVSIDAFPPHKYGYFEGKVLGIDTVKSGNNKENPLLGGYKARIAVNPLLQYRKPALAGDPHDVKLVPGMTVNAEIISKRASLISLALDKIFGKDP